MDPTKPFRLIFSVKINISPLPGLAPGMNYEVIVPLNRDGTCSPGNGTPRPPKTRTIDLHVGDDVMVSGIWRRVIKVEAYREHWLTEDEAANLAHEQGYLVRT